MGGDEGNGKGPKEAFIPDEVTQRLSMGANAGLFGQQSTPNALNMLADPGEKVKKALMRTKFTNRAERIATMHILALDKQFGDSIGEEELFDNIVAAVSEGGLGRNQLVQAIVGNAQATQNGGGFMGGFKRGLFGNGNNQRDPQT